MLVHDTRVLFLFYVKESLLIKIKLSASSPTGLLQPQVLTLHAFLLDDSGKKDLLR